MEIGAMLGDAFAYTKDALVGNWVRWLILLVGTIIFPIILGYTLLVYRGERTPPDPQDWVAVFIDGVKLFVVQLVYALPVIVINFDPESCWSFSRSPPRPVRAGRPANR